MVDRDARRSLALTLRRFGAGRITSHELDCALPARSRDRGVRAIAHAVDWAIEDFRGYPNSTGHEELTADDRSLWMRSVLFLHSGREYRWRFTSRGDAAAWPFFSLAEFENARQNPQYLAGRSGS